MSCPTIPHAHADISASRGSSPTSWPASACRCVRAARDPRRYAIYGGIPVWRELLCGSAKRLPHPSGRAGIGAANHLAARAGDRHAEGSRATSGTTMAFTRAFCSAPSAGAHRSRGLAMGLLPLIPIASAGARADHRGRSRAAPGAAARAADLRSTTSARRSLIALDHRADRAARRARRPAGRRRSGQGLIGARHSPPPARASWLHETRAADRS